MEFRLYQWKPSISKSVLSFFRDRKKEWKKSLHQNNSSLFHFHEVSPYVYHIVFKFHHDGTFNDFINCFYYEHEQKVFVEQNPAVFNQFKGTHFFEHLTEKQSNVYHIENQSLTDSVQYLTACVEK